MATVRQCPHLRLISGALTFLAVSILSLALPTSGGSQTEIAVNSGRHGPYYHLRVDLTAAAIDFAESDRTARSGGQFEIRVRPEHFPVPAPKCRGSLILRMPWTAPEMSGAKEQIAIKEALLKRIVALQQSPGTSVPVVVELNPYVEVISRTPLQVRLTQCNIFFRQAFGGYVDNIRPLVP